MTFPNEKLIKQKRKNELKEREVKEKTEKIREREKKK